MTEAERWTALRSTTLSDHEPFCNYGRTNGREMCTCQVLVDLVEGKPDPVDRADRHGTPTNRSDQRARRLAKRQKR